MTPGTAYVNGRVFECTPGEESEPKPVVLTGRYWMSHVWLLRLDNCKSVVDGTSSYPFL